MLYCNFSPLKYATETIQSLKKFPLLTHLHFIPVLIFLWPCHDLEHDSTHCSRDTSKSLVILTKQSWINVYHDSFSTSLPPPINGAVQSALCHLLRWKLNEHWRMYRYMVVLCEGWQLYKSQADWTPIIMTRVPSNLRRLLYNQVV